MKPLPIRPLPIIAPGDAYDLVCVERRTIRRKEAEHFPGGGLRDEPGRASTQIGTPQREMLPECPHLSIPVQQKIGAVLLVAIRLRRYRAYVHGFCARAIGMRLQPISEGRFQAIKLWA